jgi:hypothetical protein
MFTVLFVALAAIVLFILVGAVIHSSIKSVIVGLKADVLAAVDEIKKLIPKSSTVNITNTTTPTTGGGGTTTGPTPQKA